MSRESKIFDCPAGEAQKIIREYESFGWELLNISGNPASLTIETQNKVYPAFAPHPAFAPRPNLVSVSLTRETQNKVYPELVKFEAQYEELKFKLNNVPQDKDFKPASAGKAFLLLLLGIVPGVLYLIYKAKEERSVKELNEKLEKERNALAEQMVEVCNTSRATFFAREN